MRINKIYNIKLNNKKNIDEIYNFPIVIQLYIDIVNIKFQAKLLSWSNEVQDNVLLEESNIVEFLSQSEALDCIRYYRSVLDNYISFLYNTIKTKEQLDLLIKELSNPKFIYTKQLIDSFSIDTLDKIMKEYFKSTVMLNIDDFNSFIPEKINGWYAENIEVDGNTKDEEPYIFCHKLNQIVSSEEVVNRIFKLNQT